jgi:hypothetical protein
MLESDLIPGLLYRMKAGDFAEFSRTGAMGKAIFHPPGEPDMQSSFAIDPERVDREATQEERVHRNQNTEATSGQRNGMRLPREP